MKVHLLPGCPSDGGKLEAVHRELPTSGVESGHGVGWSNEVCLQTNCRVVKGLSGQVEGESHLHWLLLRVV